MSTKPDTSEDDDVGALRSAYRTVTPGYGPRPDVEMNAIGWALFLGTIAILFPLLPFIAIVWVLSKAMGAIQGRGGEE